MNSADQQLAHTHGAEQKTFFETSFYRMNFSNILAAPKISDEQRAAYGQTVTDHYLSVVDPDSRIYGAAQDC